MPKMGESVSEATVITWVKEVGDMIELDETIIEIATDKVDSEVPSTHEGKLVEQLYKVDDVIKVGEPFAILEIEGEVEQKEEKKEEKTESMEKKENNINKEVLISKEHSKGANMYTGDKFYSPLVKSMAAKEGISLKELDDLKGTGKNERVTKSDMISYIKNRGIDTVKEKIKKSSQEDIPETKEKCIKVGANDYMAKPIESDKLVSMIKIWVA